ncbi:MAG: glycine cleavage system aminomethyltransferase GcvT [Ignavibacteria bacterium]|nr:glycine cleavage system aminomethyltransferase GcvT [Ignavibacteria bacterium]
MDLKRTVLYEQHRAAGAKLVPFAGFEMPLQYSGVLEEHRCVRSRAGLFDVSHMGEIEVRGTDALAFIQRLTTNDASRLTEGRVQYSAMCNGDGGIIDDLLVYHMGSHFMLVVNAGNIATNLAWMRRQLEGDVDLVDASDATALIAVQGPESRSILRHLTTADVESLPYYHSIRGTVAGTDLLISRTGYTGEVGFELYFPAEKKSAETLWNSLLDAGKDAGLRPAGLGARDTLRLEMGFCLYGNDIDHTTNPLEAGLGWITKLGKGAFIGSETLAAVKARGPERKLVGLRLDGKNVPRKGYPITAEGREIGTVTSGGFSPTLERGIGMGYIPKAIAVAGKPVQVAIRGNNCEAEIVSLPFVTSRPQV